MTFSKRTVFLAMQDDDIAERLVAIAQRTIALNLDLLKGRHNLSTDAKITLEKQIRLLKMERDYILSQFELNYKNNQLNQMEVISNDK